MTDTKSDAARIGRRLAPIESAGAWYGPDMAGREDWIHRLEEAEIEDLDKAVSAVIAEGRDILTIDRAAFPLPHLGPVLEAIRREVLHGRGFALIRGLPVHRYEIREAATAFWGLGTHLGKAVSQNAKGHVLGHVKDIGGDYDNPEHRGYQTAVRLPFHCDSSDLVALLCVKPAKEGGLSSIVSSVTCYNEMVRRRPDLAELLTSPVYRDRRGEVPPGRLPWYQVPVFNLFDGRLATTYVRSAVRKAQRFSDVPRVTREQEEAFDLLDEIAASDACRLDMDFAPGDVQILSNHMILHSRTAFVDHDEPERRRQLLRLWLACADGQPLPPVYTKHFQGETEDGRPNGIDVGVPHMAPLEAV